MTRPQGRPPGDDHPVDKLLNHFAKKWNSDRREIVIRRMGLNPVTISRMRTDRRAASPRVILTIHDYTGMPIAEIRKFLEVGPIDGFASF